MRRNEFSIEETAEVELFLSEMSFGFLGTIDNGGYANVTPLNFVFCNGNLYFHGSKIGQKMRDLKTSSQVTFVVAKEYAIIPSYFVDPSYACPATSYFKSVCIRGSAAILTDLQEKAAALTAFMEKLQPEGGYVPIDPNVMDYAKQIEGVAVVKIHVQEISAKFKFGQNLTDNKRKMVTSGLLERSLDLDEDTAELMKRYCPYHKKA